MQSDRSGEVLGSDAAFFDLNQFPSLPRAVAGSEISNRLPAKM